MARYSPDGLGGMVGRQGAALEAQQWRTTNPDRQGGGRGPSPTSSAVGWDLLAEFDSDDQPLGNAWYPDEWGWLDHDQVIAQINVLLTPDGEALNPTTQPFAAAAASFQPYWADTGALVARSLYPWTTNVRFAASALISGSPALNPFASASVQVCPDITTGTGGGMASGTYRIRIAAYAVVTS